MWFNWPYHLLFSISLVYLYSASPVFFGLYEHFLSCQGLYLGECSHGSPIVPSFPFPFRKSIDKIVKAQFVFTLEE